MLLLPEIKRACFKVIHDPEFNRSRDALGLQGKNLKNTAVFIIRNVISAHDLDGHLKPDAELKPNQRQCLQEANARVDTINAERKRVFDARKKAAESGDPSQKPGRGAPDGKLHLLKKFGGIDAAHSFAILDRTLLEQILKHHGDQQSFCVYGALPAVVAQQLVAEVLEAHKGFREGLKQYKKHPEKFTGRPRLPGYKGRNDRATLTFTGQSLEKVDGYRFFGLDDKVIHTDYAKTDVLSEADKKGFLDYQLDAAIRQIRQDFKMPDNARLTEVRLVPLRNGETKMECVFASPLALPEGSFAAKMVGQLDAKLAAEALAAGPDEKPKELKPSEVNDALLELLRALPASEMPRAAAGDLGQKNYLALAFSTGRPGMILSNQRMDNILARFEHNCDQRISYLTLQSPEVPGLQAKRKAGEKLTEVELATLRRELSRIYQDEALNWLFQDQAHWKLDAMHRISSGIVKQLLADAIQILVIGLNKGWKQRDHRGKKNNRRFLAGAHSRLIEMLQYKCLAVGILVVTVEESYTSQSSFALNETLPTYDPATQGPRQPTTGEPPPAGAPDGSRVAFRGRRGSGKKGRNYFTTPELENEWAKIHADLNGAFNILRKAFPAFQINARLTSKFKLYWFSPKTGLTPMKLKPKPPLKQAA